MAMEITSNTYINMYGNHQFKKKSVLLTITYNNNTQINSIVISHC